MSSRGRPGTGNEAHRESQNKNACNNSEADSDDVTRSKVDNCQKYLSFDRYLDPASQALDGETRLFDEACMGQEITGLLTAILLEAEAAQFWIDKDPPHRDATRESLARIIHHSEQAAEAIRLVRDLVLRSIPGSTSIDINSVVKAALDLTETDRHRNGVVLETELETNIGQAFCDMIQLQRVIANLISNGINAMRGIDSTQRKLRVSTRLAENGDALVAVGHLGVDLELSSGHYFFDRTLAIKRQGVGLALWISNRIVQAHGGQLWLIRNPPNESIFMFNLPTSPR